MKRTALINYVKIASMRRWKVSERLNECEGTKKELQNANNDDDNKRKRPSTSMQIAANREIQFALLLFHFFLAN